jgi:hypothetical protein
MFSLIVLLDTDIGIASYPEYFTSAATNNTTTTTTTTRVEDIPPNMIGLSYEQLQECIDNYTSQGYWQGTKWTTSHPLAEYCGFQAAAAAATTTSHNDFPNETIITTTTHDNNDNDNNNNNNDNNDNDENLPNALRPYKIGFMGDSTTRSDLRGFEEVFECPRTNLDEMAVFQKKGPDGTYVCRLGEQSINLTKCGIPPMIDLLDNPDYCHGVQWKYFYKVFPWTPLDEWYMSQKDPSVFDGLDVLVVSVGRWFPHYQGPLNVTRDMERFIVELQNVFSGIILYQSEYAMHHDRTMNVQHHVSCDPHATCSDCGFQASYDTNREWECSQAVTAPRPQSDRDIRSVLERYHIPYLDRWNISKSLPMEYFELWYCHDGDHHQWACDHHLKFVALQHLRLISHVIRNILGRPYTP